MKLKRKKSGNQVDMINGPLVPKILSFTLIVFLTNLMQLLFNTADLIVVGQFSDNLNALGAVGATGALTTLFVNLFIGFSVGVSVICTHCYGSGDMKGFKETITTSISLSIICGGLLGILGFFFSEWMLRLMGTPEDLLPMAAGYLKIYFLCMPALMFFNYGTAILRALGNTKTPMMILAISGAANVLFNMLFVIVFHMDANGVALATTIAQYISAGLLLAHMIRADAPYKIVKYRFKLHRDKLKKIMYIGIPNAIHGTIISLSNVFIQSSINSLGAAAVTGSAAAANIEGYCYQALNSFHQAAINFTGQNYGAGKYDRIKRIQVICYVGVTVAGIVLGCGAYLFGEELLSIFIKGAPQSHEFKAGMTRLAYICIPYFLCGLIEVITGILGGLGKSVSPSIVSIIGFCGVRVAWIMLVFNKEPNLANLFLSYPLSWLISFVVLVIIYLAGRKKIFKKREAPSAAEALQQ